MHLRTGNDGTTSPDSVVLRMARAAYVAVMLAIASRPPETGGILLGPQNSNDVTEFFFDAGGNCSGVTYSPDYETLNQLLKEKWRPQGLDWKGFCHSHPVGLDRLSGGDMSYICRLLQSNDELEVFAAPVVIPLQQRFVPFVVTKADPKIARRATLLLF